MCSSVVQYSRVAVVCDYRIFFFFFKCLRRWRYQLTTLTYCCTMYQIITLHSTQIYNYVNENYEVIKEFIRIKILPHFSNVPSIGYALLKV